MTTDSLAFPPAFEAIFTRSVPDERMSSDSPPGPATATRYDDAFAIAESTFAVSNAAAACAATAAGSESAARTGTPLATASDTASAPNACSARISDSAGTTLAGIVTTLAGSS